MGILSIVSFAMVMTSALFVAVRYFAFNDGYIVKNIIGIGGIIGLSYIVSWILAIAGIRIFENSALVFFIKLYGSLTLLAILILYSFIISRLYAQGYSVVDFLIYNSTMWVALVAFLGFQLLLKDSSLPSLNLLIGVVAIIHLHVIVYRYVFGTDEVNFKYLFWDILFFFEMVTVSGLMFRFGRGNSPLRTIINRIFETAETANIILEEDSEESEAEASPESS